jgi:uracil-DNA glycosylase family 4
MEPTGSKRPIVYILGEAPGREEDEKGKQFVGKAGRRLRRQIPDDWLKYIRWNNCVRTRPPGNKTPGRVELECCRPSIVRDIEATQPRAILGFGNIPLEWAINEKGITMWRGRRMPLKVGNHTCWFFPIVHPSYVNRRATEGEKDYEETAFTFEKDIERALAIIEDLPEPVVHSKEDALRGVDFVLGGGETDGVSDLTRVLEFLEYCYDAPVVGFDLETKGTRPYVKKARILTVAISTAKYGTLAFPLRHPDAGWSSGELHEVESALIDFLYNYKGRKAVHHVAFEQEWCAFFYGEEVIHASKWDCTMSQAYILDERRYCFGLDFLTTQYFGLNIKTLSRLDKDNLDKEPLDKVLLYNGIDAKYHRLLYKAQSRRLKEEDLKRVYREHMKRPGTMVLTQLLGIPVDPDVVEELTDRYEQQLVEVEEEIAAQPEAKKFRAVFEAEFQPSSPADVIKMLTHVLKRPVDSSNEKVISKIKHKVVELVLRWRHINKVLSTYVAPVTTTYPDGKLHPTVGTTTTVTWRTSTDGPSIQNWPKRDGEQKEVRKQIKAPPGYKIVAFDYGAIQARNVAMESRDETLVKFFWDDYDIHGYWTHRVAEAYPKYVKGSLKDETVFKERRSHTKNSMVFPLFFGAQASTIAFYLDIPTQIAEPLREEFWDMFPGVLEWHKRVRKFYRKNAYVSGLTGFRRRAPVSPNELINAPIQADEAAMVCDAMYRLSRLGIQAMMEIHDDLTFLIPKEEVESQSEIIVREMLSCPFEWAHRVPLVVERSIGSDWYSMKKAGEFTIKDGVITG